MKLLLMALIFVLNMQLAALEKIELIAPTEHEQLLLKALAKGDPDAAEPLYSQAEHYISEKNSDRALALLQTLTDQTTNKTIRSKAQYKLGYLYRAGSLFPKNAKKALELYQQGLKDADPETRGKILGALGILYRDGDDGIQKDINKAEKFFMQILTSVPDEELKVKALYELAGIAMEKKNMKEAITYLEHGERQQFVPYISAQSAVSLGSIHRNKGDLSKAAHYFKKAADQRVEPIAREIAATELALLLSQGGAGLEKNLPESHKYALQALRETQDQARAGGLRALLRSTGYKGKIPGAK